MKTIVSAWLIVVFVSAYPRIALSVDYDLLPGEPTSYGLFPTSILSLGGGFSPEDLTQKKLRAVNYQLHKDSAGSLTTTLNATLVSNYSQLKQALHLDANIGASLLGDSFNASTGIDDSSIFSNNSLTLVISAQTEFGRLETSNETLVPAAQKLIDQGRMDDFEGIYGSRYVALEKRGAMASILITISDIDQDAKEAINTSMSASGGFGPLTASAKATWNSEVESAFKQGRVSVQVFSIGGTGISGLSGLASGLLGQPNSVEQIEQALANFMKTFSPDNSAPIGFSVVSMYGFGWRPSDSSLRIDIRNQKLTELNNMYHDATNHLNAIKAILSGADIRNRMLTGDASSKLNAELPVYENYIQAIADAHDSLLRSKQSASSIKFPEAPAPDDTYFPKYPHAITGGWLLLAKNGDSKGIWLSGTAALNYLVTFGLDQMNLPFFQIYGPDVTSLDLFLGNNKLWHRQYTGSEKIIGALPDLFPPLQFIRKNTAPTNSKYNPSVDPNSTLLSSVSGSAEAYYLVTDRFNRSTKLHLVNISWKANNGFVMGPGHQIPWLDLSFDF